MSNKISKQLDNVFLLCVREPGWFFFCIKREWGGIPTSPFKIGFAIVYTTPMKKFGTRYPDGVEPSHTVVCYHKILFNAEYLGEGDAQP